MRCGSAWRAQCRCQAYQGTGATLCDMVLFLVVYLIWTRMKSYSISSRSADNRHSTL